MVWFFLLKLSCDSRFQRAFTACSCVFKVITLVGSNQRNNFENAKGLKGKDLENLSVSLKTSQVKAI